MSPFGKHLLTDVLRARLGRTRPFKLTWILTEVCHHRCEICRLWEGDSHRGPSLEQARRFLQSNRHFPWINLSGGELLARPDIHDLLDELLRTQTRLEVLTFPTAGWLPEKTEALVRRILEHGGPRLTVTVSIDGDRATHDRLRGREGAYDRALETLKRLKALDDGRSFQVLAGMTLSTFNIDECRGSIEALLNALPELAERDLHFNIAHHSPHYYQNSPDVRPDTEAIRDVLEDPSLKRLGALGLAESLYRTLAHDHLRDGYPGIPCEASKASIYVGPDLRVFPCSTWDRPLGHLEDYDYDLGALLANQVTKEARAEIGAKECPGCWTPCDALPTLAARFPEALWRSVRLRSKKRRSLPRPALPRTES